MAEQNDYGSRLDALQQAYLRQLPNRVRQIEELWRDLAEGRCSPQQRHMLHEMIHRLSGSGSTFGFDEITNLAEQLEAIVEKYLDADTIPEEADLIQGQLHLTTLAFYVREGGAVRKASLTQNVQHHAVANKEAGAEPASSPPLILFAEDAVFLRQRLAVFLREAGFEVIEVDNGRQALLESRRRRPDLVLLDVLMPVMDGVEAARRLRTEEHTRDVPIIMLTTVNKSDRVQEALACDVNGYLVKPVQPAQLVERIRACLANS